jgi:predicted aspartyl protease
MKSFFNQHRFMELVFFMAALTIFTSGLPVSRKGNVNDRNYMFVSVVSGASENYEPVISGNADSVVIPLKRVGRLFLIDAKVDEQEGNLVFDTGASGLVLNSTYFRDYVRTGGAVTGGITGAVGKVEKISVGSIEFGSLSYEKLRADITNLGHIENRRGAKILGLVGFGMMKNLEIVLDAANNELKLYCVDDDGNRVSKNAKSFRADHIQRIEGNGNILFLKGEIAGKSLNFCLDTGAETNAIGSTLNKNILSTLTITRRMELKGAGTAKADVLFGVMNDFTMGDKKINDMETIVTNLYALSEVYNTKIDGMLGFNFLEQGIININFVKKQFGIHFTKGGEK